MKMKAAIYTGIEGIEVREVDRDIPPPGYVLVDTKQTGICGSDLHSYFGHFVMDTVVWKLILKLQLS